jgi:hypothetical protein
MLHAARLYCARVDRAMSSSMAELMGSDGLTLREAYLSRNPGAETRFRERLLLDCMPAWKRPLAAIFLRISPSVLAPDLDAVRAAGESRSVAEVSVITRELHANPRSNGTMVRHFLGVRASGRRLRAVAESLLPPVSPAPRRRDLAS